MNLCSAAHYLKLGYRIRRASWEPEEYVFDLAGLFIKSIHYGAKSDLYEDDIDYDEYETVYTDEDDYYGKLVKKSYV